MGFDRCLRAFCTAAPPDIREFVRLTQLRWGDFESSGSSILTRRGKLGPESRPAFVPERWLDQVSGMGLLAATAMSTECLRPYGRKSRRARPLFRWSSGFIVFALGTMFPFWAPAGVLDNALGIVLQRQEAAAQSQMRVDKLTDDTRSLEDEYRAVQKQILALKKYSDQVQTLVAAQDEQSALLDKQIGDATDIGRGVTPLMLKMVDALDAFIKLDVPFLPMERKDRVKQLRAMMDRPDVSEAEKFRRITEAYLIENEFGRTIEAYRGELQVEGEARTVEFLRVGRVALIYRTIDGAELGTWNQSERAWNPLPSEYKLAVTKGFRIAAKRAAPNLFAVPIPAPTEAQP